MRYSFFLLVLFSLSFCFVNPLVAKSFHAHDKTEHPKTKNPHPIFRHQMKSLANKEIDFSKYRGKVLMIVNTASKCGATPQYANLQSLHKKYSKKGLVILGFPCNQFGKQEPGSSDQIAHFCKKNYAVQFQMFSKINVKGKKQSPLYKYLTSKTAFSKDAGNVRWNFEKFLISKEGKVVARFRTSINPESPKVIKIIEAELKK